MRERLAEWHRVDPGRIVVAGSGSEFIFRFTAWAARLSRHSVSVPAHAFGDYAAAAQAHGLDSGSQKLRRTRPSDALRWLCEPSSPLGRTMTRAAFCVRLLVDLDALRAAAPGRRSALGACRARSPLATVDSPNKALGLTGVRAAYAIAPMPISGRRAALNALVRRPSWVLGTHGVAMLHAWCGSEAQAWLSRKPHDAARAGSRPQVEMPRAGLQTVVARAIANFFPVAGGLG